MKDIMITHDDMLRAARRLAARLGWNDTAVQTGDICAPYAKGEPDGKHATVFMEKVPDDPKSGLVLDYPNIYLTGSEDFRHGGATHLVYRKAIHESGTDEGFSIHVDRGGRLYRAHVLDERKVTGRNELMETLAYLLKEERDD